MMNAAVTQLGLDYIQVCIQVKNVLSSHRFLFYPCFVISYLTHKDELFEIAPSKGSKGRGMMNRFLVITPSYPATKFGWMACSMKIL